jgi:Arylsulfotransferase (ASST)
VDVRVSRRTLLRNAAATGGSLLAASALPRRWLRASLAADTAEVHGVHRFVSRPDLAPPVMSVLHRTDGTSAGRLFLAPLSGPGQRGTLIVDDAGTPIWFRPSAPVVAVNFRAAVYRGRPVLTWWEGKTEHGLGQGTHVIVDQSYREVGRIPAGRGRPSDLHEFLLTERGTALVTSWERLTANLSSIGGSAEGAVVGGVVQELELPSGRVLFEWRSLDHVGLEESYAGVSTQAAYDYFHVNSIELDHDGNLLVSARNTWTVYKIDRGSGDVIWRLGGKRSDFAMGPGTVFAWQHDARRHGHAAYRISLFDDGAAPQVQPHSKGLVLDLDLRRMRASVHRRYLHSPPVLAHALGSVQLLPNGNVLVGWGTAPYITEYTAAGRVLFDVKLPHGGENYRALRLPWTGRPVRPPDLAARRTSGHDFLYASWNGATEVAGWQLETGSDPGALQPAGASRKAGFETQLAAAPGTRYAAVIALDAHGRPLARSKTVRVG